MDKTDENYFLVDVNGPEPARPITARDILGVWPDHPGLDRFNDADIAAAERRGWDKAVAAIRDGDRYHQWWIGAAMDGDDLPPDRESARAVADYLETLTEEAP